MKIIAYFLEMVKMSIDFEEVTKIDFGLTLVCQVLDELLIISYIIGVL